MRIQVLCAPEFHNDFGKFLFLFFKNNLTRINHCKFVRHKSHLRPFLSYLPCIVHREYFSIIFNVKKCTLYSIKYGNCNIELEQNTFSWIKWNGMNLKGDRKIDLKHFIQLEKGFNKTYYKYLSFWMNLSEWMKPSGIWCSKGPHFQSKSYLSPF